LVRARPAAPPAKVVGVVNTFDIDVGQTDETTDSRAREAETVRWTNNAARRHRSCRPGQRF
jgi:hypothetical protein